MNDQMKANTEILTQWLTQFSNQNEKLIRQNDLQLKELENIAHDIRVIAWFVAMPFILVLLYACLGIIRAM